MLIVYPALIDTVGSVGSIVGSTATTKIALGIIKQSISSIKNHTLEIWRAWIASLLMFTMYAIISLVVHGFILQHHIWKFFAQLILTNILAVSLIVVISFTVAIYSQKRGWDPDNFVIPIESSLADGITTLSLFCALVIVI
jgi:cation transporter-like permease